MENQNRSPLELIDTLQDIHSGWTEMRLAIVTLSKLVHSLDLRVKQLEADQQRTEASVLD